MNKILKVIFCFSIFIFIGHAFSGTGCAGYNFEDLNEYLYQEQKTISMDFQDADLNTVLKLFSQQSGLNFIAGSDVQTTTVNLYLENVPVEEALERILAANDLTYEIKPGSNIFVVKTSAQDEIELMTRVYKIKHVPLPASRLFTTLSEFDDAGEAEEESEFGLLKALEELLSSDGALVEDRRTNSIIVTDVPNRFPAIEQTIARLDVRIPLILIEAEMLDVAKDKSDLLGAKFGSTPVTYVASSRTGGSIFPFDTGNFVSDSLEDNNAVNRDALLGTTYTSNVLSFAGLQFQINFLRSQTDTRSLARPRILTLNNHTAQISIETDEAIGIENTTSGADAGTQQVAQAERTETGVFLTVTPSANEQTGEIIMAIEPRVIEANNVSVFGEDEFRNPEQRGSKSILRVKDQDTIVIGGLLKTSQILTKTKVPIVSKIPILGAAFRHKDNTEEERELIIFITPQIVKDYMPEQNINNILNERNIVREQNLLSQDRQNRLNREFSYFE